MIAFLYNFAMCIIKIPYPTRFCLRNLIKKEAFRFCFEISFLSSYTRI